MQTTGPAEESRTLIQTDFETHPLPQGWTGIGNPPVPFDGEWTSLAAHSGNHSLFAQLGGWDSPSFPIKPFQLYRLCLWSKCSGPAFWVARFFEDGGRELIADHYSNLDASDGWAETEAYFVGRADSGWARLGFRVNEAPLHVDDVGVQEASREQVIDWHDRIYASMCPVQFTPADTRWEFLPTTRVRLTTGARLRVVMLGDSIINDIANSLFHVLVERHYPRTQVELVHSVGGGKGCWYYKEENRVQSMVVDHRPDLVIIGGASQAGDVDSVDEVIRQIRSASNPDILLMTGAFNELGWSGEYRERGHIPPEAKAKALEENRAFREDLRRLAEARQAAFLDMRKVWTDYIDASPTPVDWYKRDFTHANVRGQEVAARVIEAFLGP